MLDGAWWLDVTLIIDTFVPRLDATWVDARLDHRGQEVQAVGKKRTTEVYWKWRGVQNSQSLQRANSETIKDVEGQRRIGVKIA